TLQLQSWSALKLFQKQEMSAASHRISGIWEEVQKQKELERTLQLRYGNLLGDLEKMQKIMVDRKTQAQKEKEIAAESHALQLAEVEPNQNVGENADCSVEAVDCENSVPVTTSIELTGEQPNSSVGHENKTNKAMDIHTEKESVAVNLNIGLPDNKLPSAAGDASLPDNGFEESDKSQTIDVPRHENLGPDANGSSDSVDGATIENDKCSTDIVEEIKVVETQHPVIENENNSDMHSINLEAAAPASKDGPVDDGNTGGTESNV
ncbi:hypothetical protein Csa_007071, partial [Cucumis sativus]